MSLIEYVKTIFNNKELDKYNRENKFKELTDKIHQQADQVRIQVVDKLISQLTEFQSEHDEHTLDEYILFSCAYLTGRKLNYRTAMIVIPVISKYYNTSGTRNVDICECIMKSTLSSVRSKEVSLICAVAIAPLAYDTEDFPDYINALHNAILMLLYTLPLLNDSRGLSHV